MEGVIMGHAPQKFERWQFPPPPPTGDMQLEPPQLWCPLVNNYLVSDHLRLITFPRAGFKFFGRGRAIVLDSVNNVLQCW